jgi:hypothetical protein
MTAFAFYLYTSSWRKSNYFKYFATHSKRYYAFRGNRNSYKRKTKLPAKSKLLGFNCVICGRDYGSIQFLRHKNKEIKRKRRRILSKRNVVEPLLIPKRSTLNPVEYSPRNLIITKDEEKLLDKATKDMTQLRRDSWRLLPFSPPLPISERQKLEAYVACLKARVEARKQRRQVDDEEEARRDSEWNVIENVGDVDPHVYSLTKTLGRGTVTITEKTSDKERGVKGNNVIIRWNPITIIKKYRRSVDLLRHLDFKMDFYAKVLAKYYYIFTKYLFEEKKEILKKAFSVINTYRKQFSNRNWRYTWFEWFWIVRYAQAFSTRRAAKMLLALDGKEGSMSPKHIKDQMQSVIKFWEEFIHYSPYFFNFLKLVHKLIEKDPELKEEYRKILEQDENDNENYRKRMLEEHHERIQQQQLHDDSNDNSNDYYKGANNNDDFKVAKVGPERVRIHHSNPNYQKEMEQFRRGLRKEKPKKKISCTFSPSLLPIDIRIKLHKEGKIPIVQT